MYIEYAGVNMESLLTAPEINMNRCLLLQLTWKTCYVNCCKTGKFRMINFFSVEISEIGLFYLKICFLFIKL